MGVSGDRTQHVLWRFEQGQLDGIKAKVAVVMIGTNNSNNNRAGVEDYSTGDILEGVHRHRPANPHAPADTKIILLGIFPRGQTFSTQRGKILQVNQVAQRGNHFLQLRPRGAIRRHQHDDIADGPRQHAAPRHRLANADARALAQGKRLARPPVPTSSIPATSPTCRMSPTFGSCQSDCNSSRRTGSNFARADGFFALQNFQAGQRRRRAKLVAGVTVAVEESFELVIFAEEGVEDFLRGQRRRHRQITAGQTLRQTQKIRLDISWWQANKLGQASRLLHFLSA
jgi:hypothetical protein